MSVEHHGRVADWRTLYTSNAARPAVNPPHGISPAPSASPAVLSHSLPPSPARRLPLRITSERLCSP